MVRVHTSPAFLPERTFATKVLFSILKGLSFEVVPSLETGATHYFFECENGFRLFFEDQFWSRCGESPTYLKKAPFPEKVEFSDLGGLADEPIPIFFGHPVWENGSDLTWSFHFDPLAMAFFMLTRWEEVGRIPADAFGRFPDEASFAQKQGFSHIPVVDCLACFLEKALCMAGNIQGIQIPARQLVATCDVDYLFKYPSPFALIRALAGSVRRAGLSPELVRILAEGREVLAGTRNDPFDTFSLMMDQAEQIHSIVLFFFIPNTDSEKSCNYRFAETRTRKTMQGILDRGHRLGIHSRIGSGNQEKTMKSGMDVFRAFFPEVADNRQHYLAVEVPETYRILQKGGISDDYSLGYSNRPGFRCGTAHPFYFFDAINRQQLDVRVHPLIFMDVAAKKASRQGPAIVEQFRTFWHQIRRTGGEMGFLWHNSSFHSPEWVNGYQDFMQIFRCVLDESQDR